MQLTSIMQNSSKSKPKMGEISLLMFLMLSALNLATGQQYSYFRFLNPQALPNYATHQGDRYPPLGINFPQPPQQFSQTLQDNLNADPSSILSPELSEIQPDLTQLPYNPSELDPRLPNIPSSFLQPGDPSLFPSRPFSFFNFLNQPQGPETQGPVQQNTDTDFYSGVRNQAISYLRSPAFDFDLQPVPDSDNNLFEPIDDFELQQVGSGYPDDPVHYRFVYVGRTKENRTAENNATMTDTITTTTVPTTETTTELERITEAPTTTLKASTPITVTSPLPPTSPEISIVEKIVVKPTAKIHLEVIRIPTVTSAKITPVTEASTKAEEVTSMDKV